MTTITERFGSGGANIQPGGSAGDPNLKDTLRDIADDLAGTKCATIATADVGETYGIADGYVAGAPTTPSSQAVDPGGFTDWNVNVSAGYGFCNSVGYYHAAQVDLNVSTGAKIMDIGQGLYAWIVLAEAGGTVTQVIVLGVAAAWGAQTIPNDAAITAAVGHARWTKVALCLAHRTADAAVTTTEDPSLMKKWGGAGTTLLNEIKTKLNAVAAYVVKTLKG